MTSPLLNLTIFELVTALVCTAATMAVALWYLRRVRMERPAIGRFNGRDVVVAGEDFTVRGGSGAGPGQRNKRDVAFAHGQGVPRPGRAAA